MAAEPLIIQSRLQAGAARNRPRPFGAVGHLEVRPAESQTAQRLEPPSPVMPPQPKAFADMASNPAFQRENWTAFLGQAEVLPPPSHVSAPSVSKLITAQTLAAPP